MKKKLAVLMASILIFIFCTACIAEAAAMPPSPMFTINVTQLVIAIIGVVFSALLAWIVRAVIPPLKRWLDEHATTEQQARAWTMIKWLVEAAEQTITGYAMGKERMKWVLAELKYRGIEADPALIEAAVKEMKDNAYKQIWQAIKDDENCEACKIRFDDGK